MFLVLQFCGAWWILTGSEKVSETGLPEPLIYIRANFGSGSYSYLFFYRNFRKSSSNFRRSQSMVRESGRLRYTDCLLRAFCRPLLHCGARAATFNVTPELIFLLVGAESRSRLDPLFCLEPEPTQFGRSRSRLRDIRLPEPPKKVPAP